RPVEEHVRDVSRPVPLATRQRRTRIPASRYPRGISSRGSSEQGHEPRVWLVAEQALRRARSVRVTHPDCLVLEVTPIELSGPRIQREASDAALSREQVRCARAVEVADAYLAGEL